MFFNVECCIAFRARDIGYSVSTCLCFIPSPRRVSSQSTLLMYFFTYFMDHFSRSRRCAIESNVCPRKLWSMSSIFFVSPHYFNPFNRLCLVFPCWCIIFISSDLCLYLSSSQVFYPFFLRHLFSPYDLFICPIRHPFLAENSMPII